MNWDLFRAWCLKNSKYLFLIMTLIVIGIMLTSGNAIRGFVVESEYNDVIQFMREDSTDTNEYLGDGIYDCEDFAMDTQLRANRHGFSCAYVLVSAIYEEESVLHAIVAFRVGNATIYFEPQSDKQIYPESSEIYSMTWDRGEYMPPR